MSLLCSARSKAVPAFSCHTCGPCSSRVVLYTAKSINNQQQDAYRRLMSIIARRISSGRPEHIAVLADQGPGPGLCEGGRHSGVCRAGRSRCGLPLCWAGCRCAGPEEGAAHQQRLAACGLRFLRGHTRRLLGPPSRWCIPMPSVFLSVVHASMLQVCSARSCGGRAMTLCSPSGVQLLPPSWLAGTCKEAVWSPMQAGRWRESARAQPHCTCHATYLRWRPSPSGAAWRRSTRCLKSSVHLFVLTAV